MRSDLAEEGGGGGAIQFCADANWQVINSNSYGMKLYTCARWMQVLGFIFFLIMNNAGICFNSYSWLRQR